MFSLTLTLPYVFFFFQIHNFIHFQRELVFIYGQSSFLTNQFGHRNHKIHICHTSHFICCSAFLVVSGRQAKLRLVNMNYMIRRVFIISANKKINNAFFTYLEFNCAIDFSAVQEEPYFCSQLSSATGQS